MRSLKMLGIAAPDPPGTPTNPVPLRWIDWYASGMWRAMGCPAGAIDRACAARLGARSPTMKWRRRSATTRATRGRSSCSTIVSGRSAWCCSPRRLIVSVATIIGLGINADFVNSYGNWFTLVSAGFPALGTAVFGIRFQGDFGGDALRSMATAGTLRQIDGELRKDVSLSRAADLAEQSARIMLADLDEWRLVNQQHDLSVG